MIFKDKEEISTGKKIIDKKKSKKLKPMFEMRIVELADIDTLYLFEVYF